MEEERRPAAHWRRRALVIAAWSVLTALVLVTLAPITLRPHVAPAQLERFGAFGLVAVLFGLAYPGALLRMMLMLVGAAVLLEVGQLATTSRHFGVIDIAAKLTGIGVGALCAALLNSLGIWRRWVDPQGQ